VHDSTMSPTASSVGTSCGHDVQALLDAAVDGVVLIDHHGNIQAFNPSAEFLFGHTAAEVLGRNVTVLMSEPDRKTHDAHLARYLATRVPHIIGRGREVFAQRKDGSLFPAFLSVGVVAEAEPARFVGFIHDLTQQRRRESDGRALQERLWHVSRLATIGELTSGIAHQLNQPLAAIANYAQACERLLGRPDPDIEEIRGALREVTNQAVRAGDIIRRLRGLAHQRDDRRELTDVNGLVSELTELVQSDARLHQIDYRLDLSADLPQISVHRSQIQQVILNLTRNAIEALAESTIQPRELAIRTIRGSAGGVEIAVCDTGPGILPAVAPRLFEPFCTSKLNGTGLGLAISRTIIGAHGGTLDYRPRVPEGTCFAVHLPPSGDSYETADTDSIHSG
jgi:two-component system, LuxR family, sensor kinase FixL